MSGDWGYLSHGSESGVKLLAVDGAGSIGVELLEDLDKDVDLVVGKLGSHQDSFRVPIVRVKIELDDFDVFLLLDFSHDWRKGEVLGADENANTEEGPMPRGIYVTGFDR